MADDASEKTITDDMLVEAAAQASERLTTRLIEDCGASGIALVLLGEYLVGLADGGHDARLAQLAGAESNALLTRLRPLVREAGYRKQLAYSANANGQKVGES